MAGKIQINEHAMECVEGKNGKEVARMLDSLEEFSSGLNVFKGDNLGAFFFVSYSPNDYYYDMRLLPGVDPDNNLHNFKYSWLYLEQRSASEDMGEGEGKIIWLPDIIREPRGPYSVYECAVSRKWVPWKLSKNDSRYGESLFTLDSRPDDAKLFHTVDTKNRKSYIGITKQVPKKRLMQHVYEAKNEKRYIFHRFLYDQLDTQDDSRVAFRILRAGLTQEEAMDAEEILVAKATLFPHGLNAIPGGKAGLRYLAERNFHTTAKEINRCRSKVLAEFFERNPNNPLLALRLQSDDDLISRIICNNPRNFEINEVRHIRAMAELGYTEDQIAEEVKANKQRIHNLLTEKTYSRVA